jgi:hypothetical protein
VLESVIVIVIVSVIVNVSKRRIVKVIGSVNVSESDDGCGVVCWVI